MISLSWDIQKSVKDRIHWPTVWRQLDVGDVLVDKHGDRWEVTSAPGLASRREHIYVALLPVKGHNSFVTFQKFRAHIDHVEKKT